MTEEKFFKLLEKRLEMYENLLKVKRSRFDSMTEEDTETDIYIDIAQLGTTFLTQIKNDFLKLEIRKIETENNTWFDLDVQYFYLDDMERTPMNVKWINEGVVRLENESGSHACTGMLKDVKDVLTIVK